MSDVAAIQIPDKILQAIQPDAKKDAKLLIAKGLLPMAPILFIEVLKRLSLDPETDVRIAARQSVEKMPENILLNLAQTHKIADTLDFLVNVHATNEKVVEKVLINPNTTDATFTYLAPVVSEKLATLIANNQVRLLRTPQIAEELKKNPAILKSDVEKLISFLRMNGVVLEGESAELTLEEIEKLMQLDDEEPIPEEFVQDLEDNYSEKVRMSLYQYIQTINTGKKIKLALKGNKEARSLLIKDSNKVISTAVIKNPRITEPEILTISQNRSIQEEIIRLICNKQEWVKHYSIQIALANNPRTPFQSALRFTRMMNVHDLKKLSKNKNAPQQLQKMAKEFYLAKRH